MLRAILIIILLLPVRAFGMQMIGFGGAAGGCSTQTVDQSNNLYNNGYTIYSPSTIAQSFTAGDTGEVYSISIRGAGVTGGSGGQLVARLGTTTDLSSSYLGQTTALNIIYDDVFYWYEMIFPAGSRPSITATNVYYFTVVNTASNYENHIWVHFHDGYGEYSGGSFWEGTATEHYVTYNYEASDMRFSIKVCD